MPETLFSSTEGRLLGVGLALTGLMLLAFGIGGYLFPDSALTYAAITGLNLTIGRAAGMSFGYASGLGHAQVIPLNMLVETIKVLVETIQVLMMRMTYATMFLDGLLRTKCS